MYHLEIMARNAGVLHRLVFEAAGSYDLGTTIRQAQELFGGRLDILVEPIADECALAVEACPVIPHEDIEAAGTR